MIKYEAIYIDSQTSSQRKSGLIFFTEKSFSFVSEDINYEIPFHLITISSGGSGNKLVFFNNAENENISVYTSDRSVYKNEYLKNYEHLTLQLKSAKKVSRNIFYGTVIVISLFLLSVIGLIFSKDFIVEKGYDVQYGARPLKRAIQKYLEDPMAEEIIQSNISEGDSIEIDYDTEKKEITVKTVKPKTRKKKED